MQPHVAKSRLAVGAGEAGTREPSIRTADSDPQAIFVERCPPFFAFPEWHLLGLSRIGCGENAIFVDSKLSSCNYRPTQLDCPDVIFCVSVLVKFRGVVIYPAAQIGKDIHRTAEKLAKLTKLAKSKSLFDDPAAEISELSYVITQDINRLNEGADEERKLLHPLPRSHMAHLFTELHHISADLEELSVIHNLENPPNAQSNEHASSKLFVWTCLHAYCVPACVCTGMFICFCC